MNLKLSSFIIKQDKIMKCGEYKLILGCGHDKRDGWIGVDKGDYGQQVIRDLRNGLPFCNNSCEHLIADQVLEHIQSNEDFIFVMNECLRVLKQGGIFEIQVPYYESETAYKDPTHSRFFTKQTFAYLMRENRWEYGFDKRWKIIYSNILGGSQVYTILIADKDDCIDVNSIKLDTLKLELNKDLCIKK